MSLLAVFAAAMALSTPGAEAAANRDYVQLSRCAGLAEGAGADASVFESKMGPRDAKSIQVRRQADQARNQAQLMMRRGNEAVRAPLQAELEGRCATLVR